MTVLGSGVIKYPILLAICLIVLLVFERNRAVLVGNDCGSIHVLDIETVVRATFTCWPRINVDSLESITKLVCHIEGALSIDIPLTADSLLCSATSQLRLALCVVGKKRLM